jgi:hypothetical protein
MTGNRLTWKVGACLVTVLLALLTGSAAQAAALRCEQPDRPLIADSSVRQALPLAEPAPRTPFRDPVFGTCLVRITDRTADITGGDTSRGLKNEYSRVQAFNADESLLLIMGLAATWYVYDAATLQPVRKLAPEGPIEPRWHARDPGVLFYIDGTRLTSLEVHSGRQRLVRDFAADFPGQRLAAVWSRHEGSPSLDGRYWGLMAEDENWLPVAFIIYDRDHDRIAALRDMRGVPGIEQDVDHVTISPHGTYFVAAFDRYCERGQTGGDARPCGLMVYDGTLANGRSIARIMGHYDLALDTVGREVIVYQDTDTDHIAMIDLASGQRTELHAIDFTSTGNPALGLHISGRATARPGWALVSTYDDTAGSRTWMDDQVFAIELKAGGRVARLAHTRSLIDPAKEHDYWAEPHATVNRSFTRVLFTTNWGRSGSEAIETMAIELPPDWPTLPR